MRASLTASVLLLSACGGIVREDPLNTASSDAGRDSGSSTVSTDPPPSTSGSMLEYSGAIATAPGPGGEQFMLSAPLFPDSMVFQRFQMPGVYSKLTDAEKLRLVDENVKSFGELLTLCAPMYPTIVLRGPSDPPLTLEQLQTNYATVARCGYEKYGAKPYWVPQHVSEVDMCARKLGAGWHLPTDADIAKLTNADFELFEKTLTAARSSDGFPTDFYYRLEVYVRAGGNLALGNLAPAPTHVSPLPVSGDAMNVLYIGSGNPIGVRCMRGS